MTKEVFRYTNDVHQVIEVPGTRWRAPEAGPTLHFVLRLEEPGYNPNFKKAMAKGPRNPLLVPPLYIVRDPVTGAIATVRSNEKKNKPELVVQPGQEVVLPSWLDQEVRHTECAECQGPNGAGSMFCRDRSHRHQIIGGQAPQLQRIGDDGAVAETVVHPALTAPIAPPPVDGAAMHARMLARAAGAQS